MASAKLRDSPVGLVILIFLNELVMLNAVWGSHIRKTIMTTLKITSVGNSAAVLLPKELMAKLGVERGDLLQAIETENGIKLTVYDPTFDAQMKVAEEIMHENRDLLRRLSK